MRFYKLLDPENGGTIVRTEGRKQQQYVPGKRWVDSGIMMRYFCDEDEYYDRYVEISEKEANAIVGGESV